MSNEVTHTGRLIEVAGGPIVVYESESGEWSFDVPRWALPEGALEAGRLEVRFRVPEVKE